MKTVPLNISNRLKTVFCMAFIILNTIIWIACAQIDLFHTNLTVQLVVLIISEFAWSASLLCFVIHFDFRIILFLNVLPVVMALLTGFSLPLVLLFILLGITNILVLMPSCKLENYYGLFTQSFLNAVVPVVSICYLDNKFLEMSVLINVGILFCLYMIFFVLFFHHQLENRINLIFILLLAALFFANLNFLFAILLIGLVLMSYGLQIFSNQQNAGFCLVSFIVIGLLAFL